MNYETCSFKSNRKLQQVPSNVFNPDLWWNHVYFQVTTRASLAWFDFACHGTVLEAESLVKVLDEGCIIVANHVSYLDWLVLCALLLHRWQVQPLFLAKEKLFQHPLWRPIVQFAGCVKVTNSGDAITDIKGFRKLRAAKVIVIFPEGTRSHDGLVSSAKEGAVKIAARLGKPIVPVALKGFFESWPRHQALPKPAKCEICFLQPHYPSKNLVKDRQAAQALTHTIMSQIGDELLHFRALA